MRSLAVVVLTFAAPALAGPDPAGISSPRPGELVALGEAPLKISPTPYRDAKKFTCALTQGKVSWSSGEQPYPICAVPVADQAKFKPGDATVTVRVFYGKAWLPTVTETIQLTGTEAPSEDADGVAQVDPGSVKALTGGGKAFALGSLKVSVAVGADKWKLLRPEDAGETHVMFHRGNDERSTAELFTSGCDADTAAECLAYAAESLLKCGDTPERKLAPMGPNRLATSCVWTKEMGNKRTHSKELVHWEAGGFVAYEPTTKRVVACGSQGTSPAHFVDVMKFCATMQLTK